MALLIQLIFYYDFHGSELSDCLKVIIIILSFFYIVEIRVSILVSKSSQKRSLNAMLLIQFHLFKPTSVDVTEVSPPLPAPPTPTQLYFVQQCL